MNTDSEFRNTVHAQGPTTGRRQSNPLPNFNRQPRNDEDDEDGGDLRTTKRRKSNNNQSNVSANFPSPTSGAIVSTTSTPSSKSQHNSHKNELSSNDQLEDYLQQFLKGNKNKNNLMNTIKVIIPTEESVHAFTQILKHISDPNSTLASKEFWARIPPSDVVYRIVAAQIGLPIDNPPTWDCFPGWDILNLDEILGRAPFVLHKRVVEAFYDAFEGQPSTIDHDNEATLKPLQVMVGYFGGRIMSSPECSIPSTQISKAGCIEDQWLTAQPIILVSEIKKQLSVADFGKHIAQAMCELIATSHLNEKKGFRGLPVYCVLTVAKRLQVLRYTPHLTDGEFGRFARSLVPSDPTISGETLDEKICSLDSGLWTNMCFSIFLEGYRASTQAFYDLSVARAATGDTSNEGSHRVQPALIPQTPVSPLLSGPGRSSTEGWHMAVQLATQAQQYLVDAKKMESEKEAEHALSCLKQSINSWPHHADIDFAEKRKETLSKYEKGYWIQNQDTGKFRDLVEIQNSAHLEKVQKFKVDFFKAARRYQLNSHHIVTNAVEKKLEETGLDSFISIFSYDESTRKDFWLILVDYKDHDDHYAALAIQVRSDLVRFSGNRYWCEQAEHLRAERKRLQSSNV